MLSMFIDRINSAPLQNTDFSFEFVSWVSNLVDSLNQNLISIQGNIHIASSLQEATQADIIAIAPSVQNGAIWYCVDHVPPCAVLKQNGVLVQLVTAPFP